MNKTKIAASLGALALLASSVASAATVNVVASNLNPAIGEVFTLTVSAVGFTEPVGGITLSLAFNTSRVTFQAAALPTGATDPLRAATGTFLVASNANTVLDWLPGTEIPIGDFAMGTFTFLATAAGAAGIAFSDDGGSQTGWFNNNTAEYIPGTTYNNASVTVVPAPATLGLLASGLVGLMVRSAARRKRAAAAA